MNWKNFLIGEEVYRAASLRLFETNGVVYWRDGQRMGLPVGTRITKRGHLTLNFDGRTLLVHRLVWFLNYGTLPKEVLDHINDNPADNRIENLRDVTHRVNHPANKSCSREVFSGFAKVCRRGDRWLVEGAIAGGAIRKVYLGSFDTEAEAIAAAEGSERLRRFLARDEIAA